MQNKNKRHLAVVLGFALIAALPFLAFARPIQIFKMDCNEKYYDDRNSTASSTHTITGELLSYDIIATGADVDFTVNFTTEVIRGLGVFMTTSTVRVIPDGFTESEISKTMGTNPRFVVHGLTTSATVHVKVSYCTRLGSE